MWEASVFAYDAYSHDEFISSVKEILQEDLREDKQGVDERVSLTALYARKKDLGYINRLTVESNRMLQATLTGDTKTMEEVLQFAHEAAIEQIKNRKYAMKFQGKMAEKKYHTGRILMVGIGYGKKNKDHHC